jgi:hypothetical protein
MRDTRSQGRTQFDSSACYRILLQGRLDPSWSEQLGGMNVTAVEGPGQAPITMLTGWLLDQAALHGVLQSTYHLGLTILRIDRTGSNIPDQGAPFI